MILKFAVRNLLKRPFLNIVKIIGLSLSLSIVLLICLFLKNELTYDRFHKRSDRIYRFTTVSQSFIEGKHFARIYRPDYIPLMAEYFPEIESYVRLVPIRGGVIKHVDNYILISEAFECDSTFFKVFDAEFLVGNPEEIFNNPGSMVISESFAERTFGKLNPLGQILTLPAGQYYGQNIDFTVKGVIKDFPQNSHFHPEIITTPVDRTVLTSWAWTYLLLSSNADPDKIISGFTDFYKSRVKNDNAGTKVEAYLQRLSDIHLHSDKLREIESNSSMPVIYTLSIAALLLLLIAFANYANLNIGMAGFSDKFLFIGRVFGSSGRMRLRYFLTESILIVAPSVIAGGLLPAYAGLIIQKHFELKLFRGNLLPVLSLLLLFGLLGILSGIIPLIRHRITNIKASLNNKVQNHYVKGGISRTIIVLQYSVSIALIVAVIVIRRQTCFALEKGMGADTDNLICFEEVHTDVQKKFELFKEELLRYSSVQYVSAMFESPGGEANDMFEFKMKDYVTDETKKGDNYIGIFPCDYSFASIFNLKFLSGTNFSGRNEDNEGSGEYIVNETAMKRLHYSHPDDIIGKEFKLISNIEGIDIPDGKIIGVVEDFHLSSIRKKIEPLVMFKRRELWLINFIVSFRQDMKASAIKDIETVWTRMFPGYPFQYVYPDSIYENVYKTELLQMKLLSVFTLTALFICSIGLIGLSLLTTRRRTKEIGIRKINGAEMWGVLLLLNWDIVKWILLSIVLTIPAAYFLMNRWMENFAYKTVLSWWIFLVAGFTALFIALVTVSAQSWKAAGRNPVEALRYE